MQDAASASRAFRQRSRTTAIVFAIGLLLVGLYGLTHAHVAFGLLSVLASGAVVKIGVLKRRARPFKGKVAAVASSA